MEDSRVSKRKNIIIIILSFMLLLMSVGYSMLANKLVINGYIKTNNRFDIRITKVVVKDTEGDGVNSSNSPKWTYESAYVSSKLSKPNDSVRYTIYVKNFGTINATLKDIIFKNVSNDYIEITNDINERKDILVGDEINFDVVIKFKNVNSNNIPDNVNLSAVIIPSYEQKIR